MKILRSFAVLIVLLLPLRCLLRAQTGIPFPNTTPSAATRIEAFPIYTLNTAPVTGATLTVVGQAGQQTYCYWAVTNYQVGSVTSNLGCVQNGPNTLTSGNYVQIAPYSYPAGTTGVDILQNSSPTNAPSGACNCAVATGVTSGTISQISNTLSSYTVPVFNPEAYALTVSAESIGSNTVHFLLRQGWPWPGTLVCDLSTGCGSGTGSVTSVAATAPIVATPNPITNTGTISLEACGSAAETWIWNGTAWACGAIGTTSPGGVLYSVEYNSPLGTFAGTTPPSTPANVPQVLASIPGSAPTNFLPGIPGRTVTSSTGSGITSVDCSPQLIEYEGYTGAGTDTLPTATTLGVPYCSFAVTIPATLASGSANLVTQVTITPTTWTINGQSSYTFTNGQQIVFFVDPASATNWLAATPGSTGTAVVNVPFDKCVPAQTTNAGNSGLIVNPFTNADLGVWYFILDTAADVYCYLRVPHNLSGTTGTILVDLASADTTSGHTAVFHTADNISAARNLNVGTLTAASNCTYTSTTTAYANTECSFTVQSTLAADQYLVVDIHQAASASVTSNIQMAPPMLQITETF
jgi:hypothetical protein